MKSSAVESQGADEATASRLYRPSTKCTGGHCVEVHVGVAVAIRDSKQNDLGAAQPVLETGYEEWVGFLAGLQDGGSAECNETNLRYAVEGDGSVRVWLAGKEGLRLSFNNEEWVAFVAGVEAGEFTREFAAAL